MDKLTADIESHRAWGRQDYEEADRLTDMFMEFAARDARDEVHSIAVRLRTRNLPHRAKLELTKLYKELQGILHDARD